MIVGGEHLSSERVPPKATGEGNGPRRCPTLIRFAGTFSLREKGLAYAVSKRSYSACHSDQVACVPSGSNGGKA